MSTNLTLVTPQNQSQFTPEIAEALKTSRHIEFRLEAEYFSLDLESREELAAELYALTNELPDHLADVAARVAQDLQDETEDFSAWDTRSDASRRVRQIVRGLESEVRAHA